MNDTWQLPARIPSWRCQPNLSNCVHERTETRRLGNSANWGSRYPPELRLRSTSNWISEIILRNQQHVDAVFDIFYRVYRFLGVRAISRPANICHVEKNEVPHNRQRPLNTRALRGKLTKNSTEMILEIKDVMNIRKSESHSPNQWWFRIWESKFSNEDSIIIQKEFKFGILESKNNTRVGF